LESLNNADWIKQRKLHGRDVAVRINSVQSGWAEEDLKSILSADVLPLTLLVPKIEEKDELTWLAENLAKNLEQRKLDQPLRLILYIESANALVQMRKLLKTALKLADQSDSLFSVDGMVFGSDDFCADIGATRTRDSAEVTFARQWFVTVVKSFQRSLQAIDLVHIDYKGGTPLYFIIQNCRINLQINSFCE
jgi:citrate lyase subunit beta-like protein